MYDIGVPGPTNLPLSQRFALYARAKSHLAKKILIVDDSSVIREAIRALLQGQPDLEICGEAVDGLDAVEKTRELKPDLILLDLAMPKLNGAAAASAIRRAAPKLPIILFTMYEESAEALAKAVGVDVVLSKSDGIGKLVNRVRQLLESRSDQIRVRAIAG